MSEPNRRRWEFVLLVSITSQSYNVHVTLTSGTSAHRPVCMSVCLSVRRPSSTALPPALGGLSAHTVPDESSPSCPHFRSAMTQSESAPSSSSVEAEPSQAHLQELQETVSRLSSHKGVEAVLILNAHGDLVVGSDAEHAAHSQRLLQTANRYIQSMKDAQDDEVAFLQVRTKQHRELMIAPHQGYALVVLKR